MNKDDIVTELLALARQSDDSAAVNEAGAEVHKVEYDRMLLQPVEKYDMKRIQELYEYRHSWPLQANRMRREAEVMREAAELIQYLSGKLESKV